PANTRVARLVGDPAMNLLRGRLVRDNGAILFRNKAVSLALPEKTRVRIDAGKSMGEVVLGIRATEIEIANDGSNDDGCVVEVYSYEPFGKYAIVSARLGDDTIKAKFFHAPAVDVDDVLSIRLHGANAVVFDATTENAI
ncbi:MAG: hypothetical protein ACC634_08525, partial [Hyphomicrobiales bacterium]